MNASLVSRLRDLTGTNALRRTPDAESAASPAARSFERIAEALGGEVREREEGTCILVDRWYGPDTFHGQWRIGDCADIAERHGSHARVLGGARVDGITGALTLFFDLETTGLAGGAGTVAFLVGCAGFVNGGFRTRQYFLTSYGAERPLLSAVAECMADVQLLVSFNGRTFDAPLLETRYLFHRTSMPFAHIPHLDMLHTARRLWNRDVGCSMRFLERALAGVTRPSDVPSREIPARYVYYVRTGEVTPLLPVFEHNRLDLLSLAVLTAMAADLVELGASATRSAPECLGLGRLYERAGLQAEAISCYARAASAGAGGEVEVRAEALRRLAHQMRWARRHEEAAEAWNHVLALAPANDVVRREAARALAVHHEHRSKDLNAARVFATRAAAASATEAHRTSARYRLARLDRKLERSLFDCR
jgi:hypothetical protein